MTKEINKPSIALIDSAGLKSGMHHYNRFLLEALNKEGYNCFLFSNTSEENPAYKSYNVFPGREGNRFLNYFKTLNAFRNSRKHILDMNCEYVVLHLFHAGSLNRKLISYLKKSGLKILLIVHDCESFVHKSSLENLKTICSELANKLIVHNKYTRDELIRLCGEFLPDKLHVIPHGNFIQLSKVSENIQKSEAIKKLGLDPVKKHLLFFGMIKRNKGLDNLLEAMAHVRNDLVLIIAGPLRETSFDPYMSIILRNGLKKKVKLMIQYIPEEERELLFRASDMILLPYRKIYQSGVLLMAMSYGLPCIVSLAPAFSEIIEDGRSGIISDPENQEAFAEKINKSVDDPILLHSLSRYALEKMKDDHNWDHIASSWTQMLNVK
ncbi:MAG: glycosyltransferase family 1 protein [Bacteroidetes bacterium]|nr:MAG: glycosyltransferase family 1 protein [Bacteroidota bacterium]REK50959.1 MAG: glycosyltransferase family 1 protein [Bacteroidota bacterium]